MNPMVVPWPDRPKSKTTRPSGMHVFSDLQDALGFTRLA
jgi:hypothetical protein